ncbi:MAG: L-histidine N(alpha)-methyltransferase, partial [Gammaproteobacteria bacterium]
MQNKQLLKSGEYEEYGEYNSGGTAHASGSLASGSSSVCTSIEPARDVPDIAEDVRAGLLSAPRSLPPKYFYDERGSRLFEQICATPEYYPTRTEEKLLSHYSEEIINQVKPEEIIEFGSGNAQKTRLLFDACERSDHTCSYAPFDVCEPMLETVSEQLQSDYHWLDVKPLLGDYHAGLDHLPKTHGTRLYVFLGGTIGNFYPGEAQDFIKEIKASMQAGDYLLLGADRVKDNHLLDAAYNDEQGITAKFNLNLLHVLNRELKADFYPEYFEHQAKFNSKHNRIEMYLVCTHDHIGHLQHLDEKITFRKGESILTEVSHKFTFDGLEDLL